MINKLKNQEQTDKEDGGKENKPLIIKKNKDKKAGIKKQKSKRGKQRNQNLYPVDLPA